MTDLCPAKNHLKILSYTQGLVKNTRLIGYLAWTAASGRKRAFTYSALSFLGLFIPSIAQVMEALARAADPQSVGLGKKNSCR
jgi:hypothetical protein